MAQRQNRQVFERVSSDHSSRQSRQSSRTHDPPGSRNMLAHPGPQQLNKGDSVAHSAGTEKIGSARGPQQQQILQYVPVEPPMTEATVETVMDKPHLQTAEHYDQTLKELCRRVEMMRLSNYFTALHYRSRHFWLWFAPISSCIFLAGILSLASAVDVTGLAPLVLSLLTAFFSLVAFVLNFLQTRHGWSSLAQSHRTVSLELAQVGFKLEKLKQYDGGQLSSRSVSTKTRSNAVRDVYRIDVYLTAMQKCTPDIPMPIDYAFNLLVSRMKAFCRKYPNAIKARLSEYDEECGFDDPVPLEMQLDAFDLLCQEIRSYHGFPFFLPNPQAMVDRTINQFFAKDVPTQRSQRDLRRSQRIERRRSSSSSESRRSRSSESGRSRSRASSSESRRSSYESRTDPRTENDLYSNHFQIR